MKFVAENETEFVNKTWQAIESSVRSGFVLGLIGDLGVGKTTLVKSIAKKLGCRANVTSPTFVYFKEYPVSNSENIKSIKHIDLYRLKSASKNQTNEIMEWLEANNSLVIVEWADLLKNEKLFDAIISIKFLSKSKREVNIKWK